MRLIEDGCQSLGARAGGRSVGHWGDAAVFSFGCLKPVQAGEGGIIVTKDEALARELRAMRHYGERSFDFDERDTTMPAWNGRMSEFVAAIARAQLRHYPAHLANLRENASTFAEAMKGLPGLQLMWGAGSGPQDSAITQVVARIEPGARVNKQALWDGLKARGVPVWHGNFELIPMLSVFKGEQWKPWLPLADLQRIPGNYLPESHPNAIALYEHTGIGFLAHELHDGPQHAQPHQGDARGAGQGLKWDLSRPRLLRSAARRSGPGCRPAFRRAPSPRA